MIGRESSGYKFDLQKRVFVSFDLKKKLESPLERIFLHLPLFPFHFQQISE